MILFSHPTGNPNVRNALAALEEEGILYEFETALGFSNHAWFLKLLPKQFSQTLKRRSYELPPKRISAHPSKDILRLSAINSFTKKNDGLSDIDKVYIDLDRSLARKLRKASIRKHISALYSYEDACADSFEIAEDYGIFRFYELPIAYWKAAKEIYQGEAELNPDWAMTLQGLEEPELKLRRKDQELKRANIVITASQFTQKSLSYFPSKNFKSFINPYGAPQAIKQIKKTDSNKPLQVLFVGGLSQRKGLSYLFDAIQQVPEAELTIVGRYNTSCAALETELQKHRWIPSMPHQDLVEFMSSFDVMVFPSLFEGFGLVILEAMSRGLPVITTTHTAGPDIIEDEKDGFIVPIRDSNAIAEKLDFLGQNPDHLNDIKKNALEKSKQFTWKSYKERLLQCINTQSKL